MMATAVLPAARWSSPLVWLRDFLKEELAPYPGRGAVVTRMVIATTLITIVGMTFRIPYTFQGAIYALMVSRESPHATLRSAGTIFLVTGIGAAYLVMSVALVINSPLLHFLWIIASLFVAFYAISVLTNYTAAVVFAVMLSIGVPLWDRHVPAERNVEDTLWLCLAVLVGVVITAAVELVFARRRPGDDIVLPISERLSAIEKLLTCYADEGQIDAATKEDIILLELRGTSMLLRNLRLSGYSPQDSAEMAGVTALVGRLVELAATLMQLEFESRAGDQKRFRNLALALAGIREALVNRGIPSPLQFNTDAEPASVPLLTEIEYAVSLIPQAFSASGSVHEYIASADEVQPQSLLASDAFVNPEHLYFALKGCLAASICYVIYNALAWPGISTAVTTCLLTALTTIGSSHQKQLLRITGAIVGGLVLGMGSQIFILPQLDSITGFVLLFVPITALACWFITSRPRLSYFGMQMAVAFYLINLSEFQMQTSLIVARDRVVGILLGLFVMWLVFDQLWGVSAAVEMRRIFVSTLRLLARLMREPVAVDPRTASEQSSGLRETVNSNLEKLRQHADSLMFEFGPSRAQDLEFRRQILEWVLQLRIMFITRIALLKYRLRLPGFQLPESILSTQQTFDGQLAERLGVMADRLEDKVVSNEQALEPLLGSLETAVHDLSANEPPSVSATLLRSFLPLCRRIESFVSTLEQEIRQAI